MIAHQPLYGLHILGRQAKPWRNPARHLRANNRVILGAALADVMQQKGDIKNLAIDPFAQNP